MRLALHAFAGTGGWIGAAEQATRRIGAERNSPGECDDKRRIKAKGGAQTEARSTAGSRVACHNKGCAQAGKKTDGSRGLFCFVTWVIGLGEEGGSREGFPNQQGASSKVVFRDQNGAGGCQVIKIKSFKISGLPVD